MLNSKKSVLKDLLRPLFPGLISLVVFSFFTTLLNLVPPIFMMQLSERVMLSRNETTLVFLAVISIFLLAALTVLEAIRMRVLARASVAVDSMLAGPVFDALNRRYLKIGQSARNQILNDLSTFRDFVGGPVVIQLLDLFWVPLALGVVFLLHPFLGLTMLVVLLVTIALSVGNQRAVRDDVKRAQSAAVQAVEFGRLSIRNADAVRPMGMVPAMRNRWQQFHGDALGWQHAAIGRSEIWLGAQRLVRNSQLIVLMVVGALLYINQMVTAGAVFGVIYIAVRVITPVVSVSSSWRAIWNVLAAADRLDSVLTAVSEEIDRMTLPRPDGSIAVSRVVLTPPNLDNVVLGDVSFSVGAGRILGVVGPSGAGKSSLAKLLVGAWQPRRGTVQLGEHDLTHWNEDELGRYVGYVPQEIELLPGTVAENIARFPEDGRIDHEAVLEAAELAGIQDVIQSLPDGYNTRTGFDGHTFSGGQRQRIALARAVYGNPSLLVLDEPNSNLDAVGEQSLARTLTLMKKRGATVVLITHRTNMLMVCDDLLVMNAGTIHTQGPRESIMNKLSAYRVPQPPALRPVAAQ